MPEVGKVQTMMETLAESVKPLRPVETGGPSGVAGRTRERMISAVDTSGSLMDMWRGASGIVGGHEDEDRRMRGGIRVEKRTATAEEVSDFSIMQHGYTESGDDKLKTRVQMLNTAVEQAIKFPGREAVFVGLNEDERKAVEGEVLRRQAESQEVGVETAGLSPSVMRMYREWEGFVTTETGVENPVLVDITDVRGRLAGEDNAIVKNRLLSGLESKVRELKGLPNLPSIAKDYLMAEDVLKAHDLTLGQFAAYYEALNAARSEQEAGAQVPLSKDRTLVNPEALSYEDRAHYQEGLDALRGAFKENIEEGGSGRLQALLMVLSGEYQDPKVAERNGFTPDDQAMLDAIRAMTLKVGEIVYGVETTVAVEGARVGSVATLRPVAEAVAVPLSAVGETAVQEAIAGFEQKYGHKPTPDEIARLRAAAVKRDQADTWNK